jgi:hypothetical protein
MDASSVVHGVSMWWVSCWLYCNVTRLVLFVKFFMLLWWTEIVRFLPVSQKCGEVPVLGANKRCLEPLDLYLDALADS